MLSITQRVCALQLVARVVHSRAKWITCALWLLAFGPTAVAQSSLTYQDDYAKKVEAARTLSPLADNIFGEEINDYVGSLEFAVTDVSIPGNSTLKVEFRRRLRVRRVLEEWFHDSALSDWDIDLPHLYGTFLARNQPWQTRKGNTRCALSSASESSPPPYWTWSPTDSSTQVHYWAGNHLHLPNGVDEELLFTATSSAAKPADGEAYLWATKGNWHFSCLPSTSNGATGDAFLGRSPDGTRVWFDHLTRRYYQGLWSGDQVVLRSEDRLMPTKVEDRFGNFVLYKYQGNKLVEIEGSDGRKLNIGYVNGHVDSVFDGARTWRYRYGSDSFLSEVELPDATKWTFQVPFQGQLLTTHNGNCYYPGDIAPTTYVISITHPLGAQGRFELSPRLHGRTYVKDGCVIDTNDAGQVTSSFNWYQHVFMALSLDRREINGPGLAPLIWTWTYFQGGGAYEQQCQSSPCATTKTVTVKQPDGTSIRKTLGIRFRSNEGLLLKEEHLDQGGVARRTTTYSHLLSGSGQAYPASLGSMIFAGSSLSYWQPLVRKIITQDGHDYVWEVTNQNGVFDLDRFARPIKVTRSLQGQ